MLAFAKRFVLDRIAARHEAQRRQLGQQRGLAPACWDATVNAAGHLCIGGADVCDLAEEHGTPLYVVNRARLRRDFDRFRDTFRALYPHVEIGYSYKTNPLPGVIASLHEFGALAEVISHFELWLALRLGVAPANILFNGPAKTPDALELAVRNGVKLINIDGFGEIDELARLTRQYGRRQDVGVRVVTSVGWAAQFGLQLRNGEALEAFRKLREHETLVPCSLHAHLGTGIKDVPTYLQAIREMLDFARQLERELGVRMKYLDFGGGFGVPTVRPFDEWDDRLLLNGFPVGPVDLATAPSPEDYARPIAKLLDEYYPATAGDRPTVIFEPGRAVTSSAQALVLKVLAVKPAVNGVTRVILNGGKNLAMPLGYEYHEVLAAGRMNEPLAGTFNFYGPLCHPGDVLFVAKPFTAVKPGDYVTIMDAGAYFVPNQMNFSNPRPAAVIVDNGKVQTIRARERFEDIVVNDPHCWPERTAAE